MTRIIEGLTNGQDVRPKEHTMSWIPMMQFTGTHFVRLGWPVAGQGTGKGERGLGLEDLGPELYRVAFRGDGYSGPFHRYQDGDAGFAQQFFFNSDSLCRNCFYSGLAYPHRFDGWVAGELCSKGSELTVRSSGCCWRRAATRAVG